MGLTWRRFYRLAPAALALAGAGAPGHAGEPLLRVHEAVPGLDYRNVSGDPEQLPIVEQNGQGLALLDYDADGWLDLFVTNGGTLEGWRRGELPGSRLYRNLGGWRFADVSRRAGLAHRAWGTGAAAADFDADGDLDLYAAAWGANALLRNEGDGTFADVTAQAGVGDPAWSSSAAFADFDGDGRLDLYVTNYVAFDPDRVPAAEEDGGPCLYRGVVTGCGPWRYPPVRDSLYLQRPDGRFEDASSAWGLEPTAACRGMGLAPADLDGDGDVDLYIGCDVGPNLYLENDGRRRFRSVGELRGGAVNAAGRHESGMGVAAADLFDRGALDLVVTNFAGETNTYYRNDGGELRDLTAAIGLGLHAEELGWGVVAADLDGDGRRDVFVANGHIYPQVDPLADPRDRYAQPPRLFLGAGERLREAAAAAAFDRGEQGAWSLRAVAAGDLDNDGDLDLVAVQHRGPLVLFENAAGRGAPALVLRERRGGASPHGAALEAGGRREVHWPNQGYQASHDPRLRAPGAGPCAGPLILAWPDGGRQRLDLGTAGARILVVPQGGAPP